MQFMLPNKSLVEALGVERGNSLDDLDHYLVFLVSHEIRQATDRIGRNSQSTPEGKPGRQLEIIKYQGVLLLNIEISCNICTSILGRDL